MTILGILVNIAIPATTEVRRRAEAASILGDHGVIRTAVLDYYAETGQLPNTSALGVAPPPLVPSLPGGFTFRPNNASYIWIGYPTPTVILGQPTIGIIGVLCDDPKLAETVAKTFKGSNVIQAGAIVLFLLG
jgi:hypothetical protein